MRHIAHFFRCGFAAEMAYPADFIGYLLTTGFVHITRFLFLGSLFEMTPVLAGWNRSEVMLSFAFSVLLSTCIDAIAPSIRTFVQLAHTGKLEPYLVQPVDLRLVMLTRWVRPGGLLMIAVIAPLVVLVVRDLGIDPSVLRLIGCLGALILGVAINILVLAAWSLATIVAQRELPTEFIFRQVLRLGQVPPSLFGKKSIVALLIFVPIVLTSAVPAMILARGEWFLVLPLLGASIVSWLAFCHLFRLVLRGFNGTGG